MAYQINKEGKITFYGWEKGIGSSPHQGVGNMQAVNISTESGEVMANYARVRQSQQVSLTNGTLTPINTSHLVASIVGVNTLVGGIWINISASTIPGLSTGNYYITASVGGGSDITLAATYNGSVVTFTASGTATFSILKNMGRPVASATEYYSDGTNFQYRYYILDANGMVWVNDSMVSASGVTWFLPDFSSTLGSNATGLAVLNGWLFAFAGNTIWCKSTVNLGDTTTNSTTWSAFASGIMVSPATSPNPHFAFVGHQGKLYYCDGNFIGSIFPDSSLLTGAPNIQSYASYTAVTTTGTISTLINGSLPTTSTSSIRIPAAFFPQAGFSKPAAITTGTIYYIQYSPGAATFQVFSAATGGSAIDIATGATGTQYFNTFYPVSASGEQTITFTPQRLNLPSFETSQCMAEIGNIVVIGCKGNTMYPWNQVDATPQDLINIAENNVVNLITVGNMAYAFAGAKGNIYITNGSSASQVISVPDYCAGISGNEASYIEPYFTWGGAMYLRGRVWFSILDQTSSKTGNCGGIWSFLPTNNLYLGQDIGMQLRVDNRNSYGTYNGVATVLLASQNQNGLSPQYWAGWYSSITSPTYGIDFTDTTPSTNAIIETDLVPTGTVLDKETFSKIEYKLAAPLVAGETVSCSYRQNSTDSYTSLGSAIVESNTELAGYFPVNFQKGQWLQLKLTLQPVTSTSSSFVRLTEVIVHP